MTQIRNCERNVQKILWHYAYIYIYECIGVLDCEQLGVCVCMDVTAIGMVKLLEIMHEARLFFNS